MGHLLQPRTLLLFVAYWTSACASERPTFGKKADGTHSTSHVPDAGATVGDNAAGTSGRSEETSEAGSGTADEPIESSEPMGSHAGQECSAGSNCATGFCADGYCCDKACDGQCESCGENGKEGVCVAVSGAPRGTREVCVGDGPCQGECDGLTGGACMYPGNSTECSQATCTDGEATPAAQCDGSGRCSSVTASTCVSGTCDGAACAGSCTETSCADGAYCATSGACEQLKALGQSCSAAAQCASGNCVDSVCCASACEGQCQVCVSTGSCVRNSSGAPTGGRQGCNGVGTECQGACDGSSDSCAYPDVTSVCGEMSCSGDSSQMNYKTCDGMGSCSLNASDECSSSTYCLGAGCVAKKGDGNACSVAAECSSGNCTTDASTDSSLCCASGLSNCDSSCVNLQSNEQHCGSCSEVCGANYSCKAGHCECNGTTLSCGKCGDWTFESGNTEGWLELQDPNLSGGAQGNSVTGVTAKPNPSGSGQVLEVTVESMGSYGAWSVQLCSSGSADVQQRVFTANVYVEVDSGNFAFDTSLQLHVWNGTSSSQNYLLNGDIDWTEPNKWAQVHATITLPSATHIGFYFLPGNNFNGRVYVDNVQIN